MSNVKNFESIAQSCVESNEKLLPLSTGQYNIWLENQLYPNDISNHSNFVAKIQEKIDLEAFQRAVWKLVEYHDVIRTLISVSNGIPARRVLPADHVKLEIEECSGFSEGEIKDLIQKKLKKPFDLTNEFPIRFCLYRLSDEEYYLQLVEHHIALTMSGYVQIPIDLAKLYISESSGKESHFPAKKGSFCQFVQKHLEGLVGERSKSDRDYWMRYLEGELPSPRLPFDIQIANPSSFTNRVYHCSLNEALMSKLKEVTLSKEISFYTLMTAAFQVLLSRYTNEKEIIIGIPNDERREPFKEIIGYTANTLPLRGKITSNLEFSTFAKNIGRDIRSMLKHRLYPLTNLMDSLREERGASFSELFKIIVVSQIIKEYPEISAFGVEKENVSINIDGLIYESIGVGHLNAGRFDLALGIVETHQECVVSFHYNEALCNKPDIQSLAHNYLKILEEIADNPDQKIGQISIIPEEEKQLQLDKWNSTFVEFEQEKSFVECFEDQARTRPEAIAVVFQEKEISYATLNHAANQFARHLRDLGVGKETLVGIGLDRSVDLIISILGILKAGGGYLPLDPSHPQERLQFMLKDSGTEILITDSSQQSFRSFQGKKILLDRGLEDIVKKDSGVLSICHDSPDRLSYVLYTSGSTGKPKGVEIIQRALDNFLAGMQQKLNLTYSDRWLALTTISFDISNLEILLPLRQGATLVLGSREIAMDPSLLVETIEKKRITFAQATPATWQMLVDFGWLGTPNLTILSGGDVLSQTLANRLVHLSGTLWNMYGPTETTIWSSMKKIEKSPEKISIGRPIANMLFYILDEEKNLLPIGITGELYIGGLGLARGYRNRPELTAEKFIELPYGRLYRTGDLARYLPNGEVDFLGRIDTQVKIHGHRIELGEIEEVLKKCPGIKEAVVIVREDTPGDTRIVTYYTGYENEGEIKRTLGAYLPSYMMPSAYVQMTEFQLNTNGKIDRTTLPIPNYSLKKSDSISPRNATEMEIATIFEEILKIENMGIEDNFFALGGHSLLVARAVAKLNKQFHINLPLKTLFEKPTIALVAKEVKLSLNTGMQEDIQKVSRETSQAISSSQYRLWFLEQQTPNTALYSIPFLLELDGELDIHTLQLAFNTIVKRHEILRTVFRDNDEKVEQIILPQIKTNIRCENVYGNEDFAKALILVEAKKSFNLNSGPLFHLLLLHITAKRHLFFLNFHHMIFDGTSINIFLDELKCLYEAYIAGNLNPLKDLRIQYADYTHWQAKESHAKEQISWWLNRLNEAPTSLNLPIDKPRPHIQTYNGAISEFRIAESSALKKLAQKHESTIFAVLLSAFHVFLKRYTGQNDIIIGIPVSGRTHRNLDSLLGNFVNVLPFRTTSLPEATFPDLLKNIRDNWIEAFANQDVPFEKIVNALKLTRSLSHSPLVQTMFNMLPDVEICNIQDLHVRLGNVERDMAHFEFSLSVQETPQGLFGIFEYNTDLFLKETIERMIVHFQNLVKEILENSTGRLSQYQMLSETEIQQMTVEWNKQSVVYSSSETVLQKIEKWAECTPDAIAVTSGEAHYSYRELNAKANGIANLLLTMGIQPESKVVVCLERSAEFIPAILGILKAGGAYVPVDSLEPEERMRAKLNDLAPFCVITQTSLKNFFPTQNLICIDQPILSQTQNPLVMVSEEQLAYIIYTSGSTGSPKGVEIEHKSINDRVFWKNGTYPLSPNDVMLHTYSFIFDGSIINYFWPLCTGSRLLIATKTEQRDSKALIQLIQKHKVTTIDLLPSLLQNLLEENEFASCHSLKNVFSGGEALPSELIHLFYAQSFARLHNTYGPTEATVEASVWECDPEYQGAIAPIGKPIAGAKLYILDQEYNPVPIGVLGELHIGGVGLARGYFKDPSLTEAKFIPNPFSNGLIYRTGDLVKHQGDGNIEFLGRVDAQQVKIRGYRIDLREIESALLLMDLVEKTVVLAKGESLRKRLVAYVKLRSSIDEEIFYELMKHALGKRLPAYMIPEQVRIIDEFPTLLNGKIDISSLPEPKKQKRTHSIRKFTSSLELQFLTIWKEVLGENSIEITDNFFDIGGNSLLAMQLIVKIRKKLGISIPIMQLFQNPTIETLVLAVGAPVNEKPWSPVVSIKTNGNKEPFFCVHPVGGNVLCYRALSKHWSENRPFYALQARGLEEDQMPHESIQEMAKEYIESLREIQPTGPYFIGGWSFGGLVAVEMANQLQQLGEKISLLVLIDTTANIEKFKKLNIEDESLLLSELTNHFKGEPVKESRLSFKEQFIQFIENGGKKAVQKSKNSQILDRLISLAKANYRSLQKITIPRIEVKTVLIRTAANPEESRDLGWGRHVSNLTIYHVPGDHWGITQTDHAPYYSEILQNCFEITREDSVF
jgi:amino acid adenylation domain-containing protein